MHNKSHGTANGAFYGGAAGVVGCQVFGSREKRGRRDRSAFGAVLGDQRKRYNGLKRQEADVADNVNRMISELRRQAALLDLADVGRVTIFWSPKRVRIEPTPCPEPGIALLTVDTPNKT